MAFFSSFRRNQNAISPGAAPGNLIVDLTRFVVGQTPIGKPPWEGDFFAAALRDSEQLDIESVGYTLTKEGNDLTCVFLTLGHFSGTFLIRDQAVSLTPETTRDEVTALFGEPYWTDVDDDEVIFFYEYRGGQIELQFEFPDGHHLGFISLMCDGVLSKAAQRESYGVTKPWPPMDAG